MPHISGFRNANRSENSDGDPQCCGTQHPSEQDANNRSEILSSQPQATESEPQTQGRRRPGRTHRFYLELADNVERAPTIGPKTAERLEEIGIVSVADLLETDPAWIAEEIESKRVKPEDVESWQYQAMLVCQVPNLRGHDAQILVACGITDADQLADMDPQALFQIVGPYSRSKDGQKLLRGANDPDQTEVSNWVEWAQESRSLDQAA